jgi:Ca2+-binding EF-hand superfamily protein
MNVHCGLLLCGLALAQASIARADDQPASNEGKRPALPASAARPGAVQDVIFLAENRPIFLRLHIQLGKTPFRAAWIDSVRTLHAYLDRNGDGTLTTDEADKAALATLVRFATGGATALPRAELDNHPKDGIITLDELADVLRTALGPFRVAVESLASGRTDALFGQLDADNDGKLTGPELAAAPGSLARLDLDDDELIDPIELEPFTNPLVMQEDDMPGRRGRYAAVPPVIDIEPDQASLRPVRLLMKRYDIGKGESSSIPDNKLSRRELAIDPKAFASADADGDGALDTDELRRFLARVAPDLELNISLSSDSTGSASIEVGGGPLGSSRALPAGVKIERLGAGDVEIAIDEAHLEIHVDDGNRAADNAKQSLMRQFEAADQDNNGYLEKAKLMKDKDHPSPLAGLFDLLDRDGDAKLYPKELDFFVDRQAAAAQSRMVLSTSDQGRAIFAILDSNRDRRLGIREVRGTVARVTSWDRNADGRVTAGEIPHHYQLILSRGQLAGLNPSVADRPMAAAPPSSVKRGPNWFQRMDRNRDGDISPREFLGSRAQFKRLDRDGDGLIDASEGVAATPAAKAK